MNNRLLLKAAKRDGSDVLFSEREDIDVSNIEDFTTYTEVKSGESVLVSGGVIDGSKISTQYVNVHRENENEDVHDLCGTVCVIMNDSFDYTPVKVRAS